MKQANPRFTRAALLCAAAFLAAPAVAQQAAPVAPPVATTPAPAPVAPPTVVPTVDRDASTNVTGSAGNIPGADKNSTTPVNPAAAAAAEEEAAARRSATRTARPASRPAAARPAPARAAPAPAAVTASPAAPTPVPEAAAPAPEPSATPTEAQTPAEVAAAPEAPVATDNATATQTTTSESGGPPWLLIILGVLVLGGIAAFLMSRRRRDEVEVHEPVASAPAVEPYVAPVAVAPVAAVPIIETEKEAEPFVPAGQAETPTVAEYTAPVDVAPAVAEDATVEEPEAADVAALTAGAPAGNRPWLELAMRPIRAGTNVDQALVEIELTVANAGTVQAEDVRISTFMLPAGADGEMEKLLSQSRVDAAVEPLTIRVGEGARVNATLALPRADLMANDATHFQPVVVADARYRLPDGGEGRTSASFVVGIASDGDLGLFELDRPVLREDVEARLYRDPARV